MTRLLAAVLLTACSPVNKIGAYSTTDAYSITPTTRPVPGAYTVGIPVSAEGCEPDVRLPDLISEATGDYDAIVELVVERRAHFTQYGQEGAGARYVESTRRTGTCFEVSGVGIFVGNLDHDAELRRRQQD